MRGSFKFKMGVPQCLRGSALEESCRATAAWVAAAVGQWYPNTLSERPFYGLFDALAESSPDPLTLKVIRNSREHWERADGPDGWRDKISPLDRLTRNEQLDEVRSSWTRACQISRTLYDLTEYCDYHGKPDWSRVFVRYFLLDLVCLSIDTLKYHTLWLGNLVKEDETLKRKSSVEGIDGLLIDGAFRRFCMQKLRKSGRRAWILSDTLQLGLKRGFPSMKDIEVKDALRDYSLALSREKEMDYEVEEQIRRTALELMGELYPEFGQFPISLSATDGYTRKEYGLRGYAATFYRVERGTCNLQDRLHSAMIITGDVSYFGGYEEHRTNAREFRVEPEIDYMYCFEQCLLQRPATAQRILEGRVAVVREPLKVRPITAGPEDHYLLLKPFQLAMWKALQRWAPFRLTGEEFTEDVLQQLCRIPKRFGHAAYLLNKFISGDYSQATNDLAPAATRAVWETAWGSEWWDIVAPALNPHLIKCNDSAFLQKNGQLMGSPLSFPILCVINAAVGRWSYERWLKAEGVDVRIPVAQCPMLVNGDDFAAASCDSHYKIWQDCVKRVGWTLSTGKSYFSKEFVQINSRTCPVEWSDYADGCCVSPVGDWKVFWDQNGFFQIDYGKVGYELHAHFGRQIPFVNFGFLEMMSKDTAQLDEPISGVATVGWEGRIRWMKRDPYWERQLTIMRRNFYNQFQTFLDFHKIGKRDVDPELSTSQGGLSLNPHCTCTSVCCAECAARLELHKPRYALRGIRTSNFAGLSGEERPDDSLRLCSWHEAFIWKRPSRGASEKFKGISDIHGLYIPGVSAENETMPSWRVQFLDRVLESTRDWRHELWLEGKAIEIGLTEV